MSIDGKYGIQLRRKQWPEAALFKFGFRAGVGTVEETVWDAGGLYQYPNSALTMTASSVGGATDQGVEVTITGLNSEWKEVTQVATLGADGTALLATPLIRCFRGFVSGSQEPTGDIDISSGGTVYARITLGDNQTLMAVYTVPAGFSAYIHQGTIASGSSQSNKYVTCKLKIREFGGVLRTAATTTLHNTFQAFDFGVPVVVGAKGDIEARAVSSSGSDDVSITFTIILVPEK